MYGIKLRTRAFNGVLETNLHSVDEYGNVRVRSDLDGYYTSCHSLSKQDIGRVRASARRLVTDEMISKLRQEAGVAGDWQTVETCNRALDGKRRDRLFCAGLITVDVSKES